MKNIDRETLFKVCELLEIDPKGTREIHIRLDTIEVTQLHAVIVDKPNQGDVQ